MLVDMKKVNPTGTHRPSIIRDASAAIGLLVLFTSCNRTTDETLEQIVEQSYPATPATTLSVTNVDGSIRIYAGGPPVIKIQAIKKAYSAARLNGLEIKISAEPDAVSIETKYPPRKGWLFADRSGTVDYIIVVPDHLNISRVDLQNGEVLIDGMRGQRTRASLGSGRLFAHNCFGNLDLSVKSGNFVVTYDWWEPNKFSVDASIEDGNGFAFIPSDASFHLIAKTDNGKIGNDFTEQEDRRDQVLTNIDTLVGTTNNVTFKLHAADGNIRIVEANP
jgi:hypothetical protein